MYRRIFHFFLIATLLFNEAGAPWAMAAMSHDMGHPQSHHSEPAVVPDPSIQARDQHDMDHSQMHAGMPETVDTNSDETKHAGACCNGTTCQCGCVLPPALLVAVLPQLPQFVALSPAGVPVGRSHAMPSTPPFRPPAV